MAKANLQLTDGTKVTIEGTPDEVAILVQRISGETPTAMAGGATRPSRRRAPRAPTGKGTVKSKPKAKGPAEHIRDLAASNFFRTKRGLAEVQKKLEEGAHIYPVTHLSPVLFRLVRAKELRRIKEGGTWKYVNP
jgi:hypothetical protein